MLFGPRISEKWLRIIITTKVPSLNGHGPTHGRHRMDTNCFPAVGNSDWNAFGILGVAEGHY